jgi:hypothetical protein
MSSQRLSGVFLQARKDPQQQFLVGRAVEDLFHDATTLVVDRRYERAVFSQFRLSRASRPPRAMFVHHSENRQRAATVALP